MLIKIDSNIWIYDGNCVSFMGFPFPTRMTIIKLDDNSLWIHSPCMLDDNLKRSVNQLGQVKYLVSPNKLHHLFILNWVAAFPHALTYSSPGVERKRRDIKFTNQLKNCSPPEWNRDIEQVIFKGSMVMEEVVFYHKESNTLIVADLIENFDVNTLTKIQTLIAKIVGILAPKGKMPLDWRISFFLGKKLARVSLDVILGWKPKRIIMSHGLIIETGAVSYLIQSFGWLQR